MLDADCESIAAASCVVKVVSSPVVVPALLFAMTRKWYFVLMVRPVMSAVAV